MIAVGCDKSLKIISFGEEKIFYAKQDEFVIQWSNLERCLKLTDMINNTTKIFSVGYQNSANNEDKIKYLYLNPYTKNKIEGYYKIKNKGLMFFSLRKKDLFCFGQELGGDGMAFVNAKQFVLLK